MTGHLWFFRSDTPEQHSGKLVWKFLSTMDCTIAAGAVGVRDVLLLKEHCDQKQTAGQEDDKWGEKKQAEQFPRLELVGFGEGDVDKHEEKGVGRAAGKSRTEQGETMDRSGKSETPHSA